MGYIEKSKPLGDLSKEQWNLATASINDVVKGKTFYSGGRNLKTGEYVPSATLLHHNVTRSYNSANGDYAGTSASNSYTLTKDYETIMICADCMHATGWDYSLSVTASNGTLTQLSNDYVRSFSGPSGLNHKTYQLIGAKAGCVIKVSVSGSCPTLGYSVIAIQ